MAKPKFKKEQEVYYASADTASPSILKSKVTGITDDVDGTFYYNTEISYRLPEKIIATKPEEAREIMIDLLYEKAEEIQKNVKEAIEEAEKLSVKELLKRGEENQRA